jgi:hypothetical protein
MSKSLLSIEQLDGFFYYEFRTVSVGGSCVSGKNQSPGPIPPSDPTNLYTSIQVPIMCSALIGPTLVHKVFGTLLGRKKIFEGKVS